MTFTFCTPLLKLNFKCLICVWFWWIKNSEPVTFWQFYNSNHGRSFYYYFQLINVRMNVAYTLIHKFCLIYFTAISFHNVTTFNVGQCIKAFLSTVQVGFRMRLIWQSNVNDHQRPSFTATKFSFISFIPLPFYPSFALHSVRFILHVSCFARIHSYTEILILLDEKGFCIFIYSCCECCLPATSTAAAMASIRHNIHCFFGCGLWHQIAHSFSLGDKDKFYMKNIYLCWMPLVFR